MRLSDAGMSNRETKTLYPNHRLPPWLDQDTTCDRSNRLLGGVQDGAPRSNGQFRRYKALARKQIIIAGLIDDPKITGALSLRVRKGNVYLQTLERTLVARVIETNEQTFCCFCHECAALNERLDFHFALTDAGRLVPV